MNQTTLESPTKKERLAIRSLILIGLLGIINFFYWFLDFNLIEDQVLYWMLMSLILFDTFRLVYIWYHYWDMSVPIKPTSKITFTVDVLTTYFPGEPKTMLKETLMAIKAMNYQHTTYLCDEANDAELKEFCLLHDIVHVTRTNRIDAKAGNINNALKQATGEICLILDPDHVPKVNFLEEIIPYFEDAEIGFVQTVQSYYNVQESSVALAAAEQTFQFYGPVMMCMNSYGTVNAIGANCIFRRSALDSIGGHAAGLSEDMHTAMQLHAKGWKSVYVPMALSAGLAPATLTSYFSQQLKWSRGTLELLFTSFPKLFNQLTFRQKLHYGILPFHYLTGLFYMISFLIPIVSLLTSDTPWKGNVLNFGLITLPVIASILGIRFYVQKWVINKGERGMHLLGGLLMQITWSIYLMGLFYTVIRKKVPYLPTSKNDVEKTNFLVLLPNLMISGVCLFSIVYGLMRNFTPFSLFMSGFALWNAMIMLYTLRFAYQSLNPVSFNFDTFFNKFNSESQIEKMIFRFWQKSALVVLTLILIGCGFLNLKKSDIKFEGMISEKESPKSVKYLGVFAPSVDDGLSDLRKIPSFEKSLGQKTDIVSYYIAWDKSLEQTFPEELFKKTYDQNSLPLITWEPWLNTFIDETNSTVHVFDLIIERELDDYIEKFALKIKNLEKPVFLRFAHEFDNPFYPWFDDREDAAFYYKEAWKHTWEIFDKVGATNAIWVYNPWKADKLLPFFPGDEYVDWIGVNILNYATHEQPEDYFSFKELYQPFHDEIEKLDNFPVMIAELGSIRDPKYQSVWLNEAMTDITNEFTEIDAVIYFNSNVDNNLPLTNNDNEVIDWTLSSDEHIETQFKTELIPSYIFNPIPKSKSKSIKNLTKIQTLRKIKGVNLKNGLHWNQDYHVLNRKHLEHDFAQIRNLGLNTIKYTSNRSYDYNVVNISKEFDLQLSLGFWIPDDIDFIRDTVGSADLKENIIRFIEKYKDQGHIISWNIQNDLLSISQPNFHEPQLTYINAAYINWLQDLTLSIKSIDPIRPIVMELDVNKDFPRRAKRLIETVQGLDAIGLVIKDDSDPSRMTNLLNSLKIPYIYSDISLEMMDCVEIMDSDQSFFVHNWKDQYQSDKLTFDGLVDRKGRYRADYFELHKKLNKVNYDVSPPSIRILRTLELLDSDKQYFYYAMIYDTEKGWRRIDRNDNFKLEWSLVKCDVRGNYLNIEEIGNEPDLLLDTPEHYETYRLQLTVIKGNMVHSTLTELNTPYLN